MGDYFWGNPYWPLVVILHIFIALAALSLAEYVDVQVSDFYYYIKSFFVAIAYKSNWPQDDALRWPLTLLVDLLPVDGIWTSPLTWLAAFFLARWVWRLLFPKRQ